RELEQTRIIDNISASYEIIDNLVFKSAWSIDLLSVDEFVFNNGRYGDGRNVNGTANEAATDIINWLGTQTLSYSKTLADDHNLEGLLGYEAQKSTREAVEAAGEGFPHPELRTLSSAANPTLASSTRTEFAFNSIFSRINYDYQSKYFFSASLRRDGSSRFGLANRWGTFYSVGVGYNISEESFMKNFNFVDFLKVRMSYGVTGNAAIGNFDWAGLYGFNVEYDGRPGAIPSQVANRFLTWESQGNYNIGADGRFFNNRISGSLEFFRRVSSDLILSRPLSLTSGFRTVNENVGDMRNQGIEMSISGDVISTPDMKLTVGGNITLIRNELTRLPDPILTGTKRREVGRDYQDYYLYGWAGVDASNGDPLWYTDSTQTETTNNINNAVRYYTGESATPDFFGGFNLNFSYKGFYINTLFNFQFGNYVYDAPGWVIHGDGRFTPRSTSTWAFENRWTTPGEDALFPQHRWGGNQASNTQNSSRYLFDGSFIRLKNLNMGYDFPLSVTDQIGIRSLRVYMNLSNFWTWTRDENLHFDPEQTTSGVYNSVTPISKTVSFGVNIGL
ncbi:MAG: SusC/RagA family TonB-linked outer membrane protein, partial [Cyclobacteriaceae bacterium]